MLSISDLKVGTFFEIDGSPHMVLAAEHSKMGRGGAVLRTKIRNLTTGVAHDRTFQGSDSFPKADVSRRKGQFLYVDPASGGATFMEVATFEQYTLSADRISADRGYLKEGIEIDLVLYNDSVLTVTLPAKVDLVVTYTEPGFKGDTQSTVTKPAELETGLQLNVPLFVKTGDTIRVSTQTGQYIERVS